MKMKMIPCTKCKSPMPELRLTRCGYDVCVECSTIGAYRVVTTVNGNGDHTWNDIQILTPEQYNQLEENEENKQEFDEPKE